ncbi:MAG: hypothetical protein FJ137_14535 [Deltaproteobacteria bacterium]|nr:hypothetical protein [Deltaproteobacteria bacterium]
MNVSTFPVFPAVRHARLSPSHAQALLGHAPPQIIHTMWCGDDVSDAVISVDGPGGRLDDVRVVLPFVPQSYVAVPLRDARRLGVTGALPATTAGAPGCTLRGPAGVVVLAAGVVAADHVVLPPGDDATVMVDVFVDGDRPRLLRRVPVARGASARLFVSDDGSSDFGATARARLA